MVEQLNNILQVIDQYNGKFTKPVNDALENCKQVILKAIISCDNDTLNETETKQKDYTIMFMVVNGIQLLFDEIRLGVYWMGYTNGGYFINQYDPFTDTTTECPGCKYFEISDDKYRIRSCNCWKFDAECPHKLDERQAAYDRLEFFIKHNVSRIAALIDDEEMKIIEWFTKNKTKRRTRLGSKLYDSLSCVIVNRIIEHYPITLKLCDLLIQNRC